MPYIIDIYKSNRLKNSSKHKNTTQIKRLCGVLCWQNMCFLLYYLCCHAHSDDGRGESYGSVDHILYFHCRGRCNLPLHLQMVGQSEKMTISQNKKTPVCPWCLFTYGLIISFCLYLLYHGALVDASGGSSGSGRFYFFVEW